MAACAHCGEHLRCICPKEEVDKTPHCYVCGAKVPGTKTHLWIIVTPFVCAGCRRLHFVDEAA